MSKKLILGLALAGVLFGGTIISATAQSQRDMDRTDATCQGAFQYGPSAPEPMGAPGAY